MSLHRLPVEVLLQIEFYAKDVYGWSEGEVAPSLKLSWVCQQLRAVFMPRFWSSVTLGQAHSLPRLVTLLKISPSNTYRDYAKYIFFGEVGGGPRIDARLYSMDPTPSANDQLPHWRRPRRMEGDHSKMCGPRVGETWPAPIKLIFNDPKRYFKLAGRKRDADQEYESDETGSSAASEAEEEQLKCTVCHPVLHEFYRHRVKPDDYWLPGAVHSIGPLEWNRRTWGRFRKPGQSRQMDSLSVEASKLEDELCPLESIEDFVAAIPKPLCEKLAQHPTFHKLKISARDGSLDYFSSPSPREDLLLLADKITVLEEHRCTFFGDRAIPLARDDDDNMIYLPLTAYDEDNSMRGFMDFLLATKKIKHLSAECAGVFITPCLLGVFAKLHSLHWDELTAEPDERVIALSKLRSSLWRLAKAVGRPGHLLEPADVQLLSESTGEHADIAIEVAALADWLCQEELAALVAQGWNEQEERGPNESRMFYPPCLTDFMQGIRCSTFASAYENPTTNHRH